MVANAGELKLTRSRINEREELSEEGRLTQSCFLSELPGVAIGIVTLGWILASLATLM